MRKIIVIIFVIFFISTFAVYKYQTYTSKPVKSILFQTNSINLKHGKLNIENLKNNVLVENSNVSVKVNGQRPATNKIKVNATENIKKLRDYIVSWYNDGNQMNNKAIDVKYVVPTKLQSQELFLFTLTKNQANKFISEYGGNNIMISIEGKGIEAPSKEIVKPSILVNGIPAYGFSIFNVDTIANGIKKFDYGFVTGEGVIISRSILNNFAKEGKVKLILTGNNIEFNGNCNNKNENLV